jgi:hypothetical protein
MIVMINSSFVISLPILGTHLDNAFTNRAPNDLGYRVVLGPDAGMIVDYLGHTGAAFAGEGVGKAADVASGVNASISAHSR